jgi:hypothetical protein
LPEKTIAGLFNIQDRFVRSLNLERDFFDASSLEGYVITPQIKRMLDRLRVGLVPGSTQRAWRITGDYGSGKSSFALLLANLFGDRADRLPPKLKAELRSVSGAKLLPVLVTGSREPLAVTLLRALAKAIQSLRTSGPTPQVLGTIERLLQNASASELRTTEAAEAVEAAADYASRTGRCTGLLILLDELGKSLEFSALHPEKQDVFLLQVLAEIAARSGKRPIFIVGLLHQGFNAYAESLSQSAQREWEKVAGRFDEIIFSQPLDQVAYLIAEALSVKASKLPINIASTAEAEMERVLGLGWYGPRVNPKLMLALSRRLYPIHPTVIPVLVRLFSRFGQNERSLFSFLLSNEPFGLQAFAERSLGSGEWFRLNNLFDYTRASFGYRLGMQSYRSHWNQIDSVIESFPLENVEELEILKSVGILNLVDSYALPPTAEILRASSRVSRNSSRWEAIADKLQRQKRVLYFRGPAAGYCLWPNTSVNLEKAYEDACSATGTVLKVSSLLGDHIEDRPIVARRHYIQTGNLRHFDVDFVPSESLERVLRGGEDDSSDGRIVVALCDTEQDRHSALATISKVGASAGDLTLVAVPRPLNVLVGMIQEVQRWQWIMTNTPELNHDRYAANEVSRQVAVAQLMLKKAVLEFIGLQQADRPTDLRWFRAGAPQKIREGKELLASLSTICDQGYPFAPCVKNELVNRRQLSSAAAAARMRLIERIFTHSEVARLGMDEGKTPPEMSMYLSVLVESGLHRFQAGRWILQEPRSMSDPCNIRPSMTYLLKMLQEGRGRRIRVSDVIAKLRRAPYGLRDGLSFLLLAVFAQIREQDLAFYENGSFMKTVGGEDFLRIVKEPASFEVQFYEMSAVRSDLYRRLSAVLQLPVAERGHVELLDIVRPLCQFVSNLPFFTQRTVNLDEGTLNVRRALLDAREPATLLFENLPHALNFDAEEAVSTRMEQFVQGLRDSLERLRLCYSDLLGRIDLSIGKDLHATSARSDRRMLSARARSLLVSAAEPRLKAFCVQLADEKLADAEWLEALASLVCSKPASKWLDRDQQLFERELSQLAGSFLRLESLVFSQSRESASGRAFRVAITKQDGFELERVVFFDDRDGLAIKRLESKIMKLLENDHVPGEVALAQVFWQVFSTKGGSS